MKLDCEGFSPTRMHKIFRNKMAAAHLKGCAAARLLFLFGALQAALSAELTFSFDSTPGQLPKTVGPRRYEIVIRPDLDHLTTHGSMMVEIEVVKPVRQIIL